MKLALAQSAKYLVLVIALQFGLSFQLYAGKSYSSGGHSYSSGSHSSGGSSHTSSYHSSGSSTHSSGGGSSGRPSSGGGSGKSFSSGSGKSYSSHASPGGEPKGYSSGKSYSAGSGTKYSSSKENSSTSNSKFSEKSTRSYSSGSGKEYSSGNSTATPPNKRPDPAPSTFSFDTAAARARKEEASKQEFNRYKEERQNATRPATQPVATDTRAYTGPAPPVQSTRTQTRTVTRTVYVPDAYTIRTRSARWGSVFTPYYYRPVVVYHDSYSSFFWWWLLDQSLDQRAYWAYHHRWDMDDARYQALLASDARLQTRISELEAQQVAQDPSFTPAGLDRDLMYNDQYVSRAYSNRPTTGGRVAFWIFAVPGVAGACCFFIWIIWFKRWKTTT